MTELKDSPLLTDTGLDVVPLAGYIGAELSGVDLRGPLEPPVVEEIRSALHRYKVIFFRGQQIGHAEQVAFARLFGKVTHAHPTRRTHPRVSPRSSRSTVGATRRTSAASGRHTTTVGTPTSPHW